MAAYARSSDKHWPPALVELGLMLVDVGDRDKHYGQGKNVFMLGFAWQLLKGWFTNLGSSKAKAS